MQANRRKSRKSSYKAPSKPYKCSAPTNMKREISEVDNAKPNINFFDLERVYPKIFQHFELADYLNISLVCKRINGIVSPEIVGRSKLMVKELSRFPQRLLKIKEFQRPYNAIDLGRISDKTLQILKDISFKDQFKIRNVFVKTSDLTTFWDCLKKLKEVGGFVEFYIHFELGFENEVQNNLPPKAELSEMVKQVKITELSISLTGLQNFDPYYFPDLRVLRMLSYSSETIRSLLASIKHMLTGLHISCNFTEQNAQEMNRLLKEMLEKNAKTLRTVVITYTRFCTVPKILPVSPKIIGIHNLDTSFGNINNALKGQQNLEKLSLEGVKIDDDLLTTLLANENLWDLTIDDCEVVATKLNPKYGMIFLRLRKFTYKVQTRSSSPNLFDLIGEYLINVSILLIESKKSQFNLLTSYKNKPRMPNLQRLTIKEPYLDYLPLFSSLNCPSLKSLYLVYFNKVHFNLILEEMNKSLRSLIFWYCLDSNQAAQISHRFANLDTLTFKTTDKEASLSIIKVMKREINIKNIKMILLDTSGYLALNETLQKIDAQVNGIIQEKCIGVSVFSGNPVSINIENYYF